METQLGFITCLEHTAKKQQSRAFNLPLSDFQEWTLCQTQHGLPQPRPVSYSPPALALAKKLENFNQETVPLGFLLINV